MSTTKTADGTRTIWAVASGVTVPTSADGGVVLFRGQWVTLTPEQVALTRDRNGDSWLDLDAESQVRRFGHQRWADGFPPEGVGIGADDELARFDQRRALEDNLKYIADPVERDVAAKKIREQFGRGNPSAQRSSRA